MRTLVIHPADPTTDFLKEIYKNTDWTILTKNQELGKSKIRKSIIEHDRIVLLGHGNDYGLLGFKRHIIDSQFVNFLREKDTVCIWCNADKFVEKYKLSGFYTGMIVSELDEAQMFINHKYTLQQIDESNELFSFCIARYINQSPQEMVGDVKSVYDVDDNPIVKFNRENIYHRKND